MKNNSLKPFSLLCAFTIFLASGQLSAQENNKGKHLSGSGNLEIGVGYQFIESPLYSAHSGLNLSIKGRYELWGAFVEMSSERAGVDGLLALGYNLLANDKYSLDLYSAITDVDHTFKYKIEDENKEIFRERLVGSGFRFTRFWDNSQMQFKWLPHFNESFSGDSLIPYASIWYEHRLQLKNWSLSGLVGARYLSKEYLNHFYGISQSQADELLPVYSPGSGVDLSAKLSLSYPLTRSWVFESSLLRTQHSGEMTGAPIIEAIMLSDDRPKSTTIFNLQIKYVF